MKKLIAILKSFTVFKGPLFTGIGIALIGGSIWMMYHEKEITDSGIELLIAGLAIAGLNEKTIGIIRNKPNDPMP